MRELAKLPTQIIETFITVNFLFPFKLKTLRFHMTSAIRYKGPGAKIKLSV